MYFFKDFYRITNNYYLTLQIRIFLQGNMKLYLRLNNHPQSPILLI